MKSDDLDGCIVTPEQTSRELEVLERQLAGELGISGDVRSSLLVLETSGKLEHSELIADWQQTYASYRDWLADEAARSAGKDRA